MSAQSFVAEARRRVGYLNLPEKPARLDGLVVELIEYDTDKLAGFCTGIASAEWHRCVNNTIKRILTRRHAIVNRRVVTLDEAVRWEENSIEWLPTTKEDAKKET